MRLIDADALIERHCEGCNEYATKSCKDDPICATLMWIVEEPTVEAEPVKHGRWEKAKYIEAPVYVCSECGNREPLPRKFCPECGLMMKKEE